MSITVEITGGEAVSEAIQNASEQTVHEVSMALEREVFRIEASAKDFAAVDTGRLRSSIHGFMESDLAGIVQDGVDYGAFLEFGTSRMQAQPFMRPAIELSISDYLADLTQALERTNVPKR